MGDEDAAMEEEDGALSDDDLPLAQWAGTSATAGGYDLATTA